MGIITDILKEIPLSAVLREKIINLETQMPVLEQENFELKIQIINLTHEIQQLNHGIYKSKETGHCFCTSCLLKNIESPLTERPSGWRLQKRLGRR